MTKLLNYIGFFGACASLLCVAENVFSDESKSVKDDTPMEEVKVWGTKVFASSVSLDQEYMAIKQSDHISDLLRTIPGVDVGGAHSLNQRITIRSMDDKDLRITIDGANQNTYMYHHMGNLQIHADILKSVEIDVGNNSVVNGGLGGAVRFETRSAEDLLEYGRDFGARLQVTVADNASSRYGVTAFGKLSESFDILAYYNFVDRENYEVGGGEIQDPEGNKIPGTDGKVRGLEGELSDALIKLGWDISDNQRIKLGYERYLDDGDYSYRPDMGLATDLAIADSLNVPLTYPTEFTRDTLTLNHEFTWGGDNFVKTSIFQNTSTLWRDERGLITWFEDYATINEGEAKNSGINVIAETLLDTSLAQRFTYGVELINYDTDYIVDGQSLSSEDATNSAVFLEDNIEVNEYLNIIPGLRYDSYDVNTVVVSETFSDVTYALAAELRPTNDWIVRASTTELFKGPEVGEVFTGAGLFDTPNPDIEAETGTNTELAVNYQAEQFSAGITYFQTDIEAYIYDYTAAGKDNVGDMSIDGFEAFTEIMLGNLTALLTFSSAESELDAYAEYADLDGARIDRQQGDTISFNLDYSISSLNVDLHWDVLIVDDVDAGPDLDGATLDNAKDGFTLHNISAKWLAEGSLDGLSITVGIDNLFDEYYASQSSRTGVSFHPRFGQLYLLDYEPGRNMKATVAYKF